MNYRNGYLKLNGRGYGCFYWENEFVLFPKDLRFSKYRNIEALERLLRK